MLGLYVGVCFLVVFVCWCVLLLVVLIVTVVCLIVGGCRFVVLVA